MKFLHPDERILGTSIPLAALKTNASCGVGEFADLVPFSRFCADCGIALIQLLPVNDTGLQSSPYSALSAFALNPVHGRPSLLPGAKNAEKEIDALIKSNLNPGRFVYHKLYQEKMEIFKIIFESTKEAIVAEWGDKESSFSLWANNQKWLIPYAVYTVLKEEHGYRHWRDWGSYALDAGKHIETRWKDRALLEKHLFPLWLQFQLFNQFEAAAIAVRSAGIDLKGDIPILMNEDSCDVWSRPELFSCEAVAGAPPDMFSPTGQNWQFPIYRWDALEKEDFGWWKERLAIADRFYSAFRIDHVLGFFRIWACSNRDSSSVLGWYHPSEGISRQDLFSSGFDEGRLRWLSEPHLHSAAIEGMLSSVTDSAERVRVRDIIQSKLLSRLPGEELWLFQDKVQGEKDIEELGLPPNVSAFLITAWRDRALIARGSGENISYSPSWYWKNSSSWKTLSHAEQQLLSQKAEEALDSSEKAWEQQGYALLAALSSSIAMLPCAEDLGAVPDCVPKVLKRLGILGLRVVRWYRNWDMEKSPYIPLSSYGKQSVCTPAVHDSSTLREWWEREADQEGFSAFIGEALSAEWTPIAAKVVLKALAKAQSDLLIVQIQDLLHLSGKYYAKEPSSERINIPGTVSDFNWTWRLPETIETLQMDSEIKAAIGAIAQARKGSATK